MKKKIQKAKTVRKKVKKVVKKITKLKKTKKVIIKKSSPNKVVIKKSPPKKENKVKEVVEQVLGKKTRRKKSAGIIYFSQETEDSIVEFNLTDDRNIREEIYNTKIKYPFDKLVENIFNTFKFSYFETGPLDVQRETISHLVANIHKFESGKGKAFSYFSIIAKHYLIALNNSTYKRRNQHVEIGDEYCENTIQLQTEDKFHKNTELFEFMNLMIEYWEKNVTKIFTKQRDLDIANGVIELFRNTQNISMFNKKALYLMIREISGCRTQQVTKVVNKMKQYQTNIYKLYLNTGDINVNNYIKI